jgi:hypothetical protein
MPAQLFFFSQPCLSSPPYLYFWKDHLLLRLSFHYSTSPSPLNCHPLRPEKVRAKMTSTSVYPYTQGPTPTQWAGISSNGPPGAPFACTPSPTSTIFNTYEWVATGNGCPIGYDYASADTTCIWDDSLTSPVTFIWECLFTVGANANTTVDGGTTTVADGNAITVTANPVTITVTQTVQQSDTVTSIVAPGADTISVTSTVTQNGALVRKHQPQVAELEEKQTVILHNIYPTTDVEYSYFNSSNLLIPRQCVIQCSVYCCKQISSGI